MPLEEARHAAKTLRLRPGSLLELCDGRGHTVLAQLAAVDRQGAVVTTAEAPVQARLSGWQWEVACACGSLKGGRSDVLVEKCAELGAAAFTPVLTDRSPTIGGGGEQGRAHSGKRAGRRRGGEESEDEDGGGGSGREGRWGRVATAAMKQCLRPHAMALRPPASVAQLCQRIRGADAALVGTAGAPPLLFAAAALAGAPPGHGILCIGPEGDWTPEELAALLEAGAMPVGLGDLRLRAETAAVAMLAYTARDYKGLPAMVRRVVVLAVALLAFVSLAAPFPPPPPPTCWVRMIPNVELRGGDIPRSPIPRPSASHCCAACIDSDVCTAWTYDAVYEQCFLKYNRGWTYTPVDPSRKMTSSCEGPDCQPLGTLQCATRLQSCATRKCCAGLTCAVGGSRKGSCVVAKCAKRLQSCATRKCCAGLTCAVGGSRKGKCVVAKKADA
ncbi:ribosomal RNA small subunit methyltransferase isoform B [Micractinium conductrix]|uniref:16S rRNA (uracil(1498)-N(3))-methyltransferase n=1 Tax=Micractinium conductrix TaxID=554055 RepID=A0A2P6VMI8_9CHLO|nr:ribosomal RNA small subunit methyltransferase isoform B [Micractinium conductrix]|eukprot:PSC75322.1 ribosomal RNA small subunit methyltransferase isoform B [Micractinium conductrix]